MLPAAAQHSVSRRMALLSHGAPSGWQHGPRTDIFQFGGWLDVISEPHL